MKIGLVGLGKMGFNMRERLRRGGHEVVGYDLNAAIRDVNSLNELIDELPSPRVVWVMVPSGDLTRAIVERLAELLDEGDIVIEGGNSRFTDDQKNAALLHQYGIRYLDCGVSGGVWGLENGYGLMVGGATEDVEHLMPIFDTLRPEGPRNEGFVHAGDVGAGHYAKMVHNAIEYAIMQAWAEGYELLKASGLVTDVTGTFRAWQRGTVVRSWLLDLLVLALEADPDMSKIAGIVPDSGEARWAIEAAIEKGVPFNVIAASLFARFSSQQNDSPGMKVVAALRQQFGGHAVVEK